MFGMSLGEIMVLLIVGIVVVGPKNLPAMMRTAGQWVSKLRRMSTDLRAQSGIDDLIRAEGLEKEIHELRALSRINVVDSLISPMAAMGAAAVPMADGPSMLGQASRGASDWKPIAPLREREYPLAGCDNYRALPDDAGPYLPHEPMAEGEAQNENGEAAVKSEDGDAMNGDGEAASEPAQAAEIMKPAQQEGSPS